MKRKLRCDASTSNTTSIWIVSRISYAQLLDSAQGGHVLSISDSALPFFSNRSIHLIAIFLIMSEGSLNGTRLVVHSVLN